MPISSKNVKNAKIANAKPTQSGPTAQELEKSTAVWMCLKCAIQCCSTPSETIKEKHEIGHCHLHYKTPRSDLHCIFLHLLDWTLFCFECKDTLYIDSFKRLREAVEVTKRMTENKHVQNQNNIWHDVKKYREKHKNVGPLLDDGLKLGTPKAMKGLPLSLIFCLCVCVSVCLLPSYRPQFSTQQPNYLKICSLGLWKKSFSVFQNFHF